MTEDATLVQGLIFPRLIVRPADGAPREIELKASLCIGRAEDNDLTLADPKVSRHHARIERQGTALVLTDLDSANGTWVNEVLLVDAHTLKDGDRIQIGDAELVYRVPGRGPEDTLIAAMPVAPLPTVTESRPFVVPPPPETPESEAPRGRGVMIALGVAGILLVAALIVGAIYWLAPDVFGPATPTTPPTQTPQVVVVPRASDTTAAETPPSGQTAAPSTDVEPRLEEANQLARRSQFEQAAERFQELVDENPTDARPHIGWAWALIWDYEPAQALPHAQEATELDPTSADAAAALAWAYVDAGEEERGIEEAQRAIELDSGNALAHAALAHAYRADGQFQKAVDEADRALVHDINLADAHRIRGWLYYAVENDIGRAAGELQIAAGLQPELWLRRHELGELLLEAGDEPTAIMAFQDALGIRPKAVTYTAIGQAYYRLGQYDQAKASLEQALEAGAKDLDTLALLGITYARLDRCEEAAPFYEDALEMDAADPLAREARDLCEGAGPTPQPSEGTGSPSAPTPATTPGAQAAPRPTAGASPKLSGRLAFPVWNRERGGYDVYIAQVDGSNRRLVVEQMHQPAFSPDGAWLAVNGERPDHMNLFIVQSNGSGLKEISRHLEDSLPVWSPDGQSLAFSSTMHGDRQSRVYILDPVPFVGRAIEGRALNFGPDDVRGKFPAWTGDGRIVYQGCDLTVEPARCGLYIMPSAPGPHPTTQLTEYAEDSAPAVHGDRIAFASNREGNWDVYVMGIDGADVQRLTDSASNEGLPVWSPDGRSMAYVSNQGGEWSIWAMNADGSNQRRLFALGDGGLASDWQNERISWAP